MVSGPGQMKRACLLWDVTGSGVLEYHDGLVPQDVRRAESLEYLGSSFIAIRRIKQY